MSGSDASERPSRWHRHAAGPQGDDPVRAVDPIAGLAYVAAMRTLVLCLLVSCGNTDSAKNSPPAQPIVKPAQSLEDTAKKFVRAALSGDRATAQSLTLTADEVMALSTKGTKEEWNEEVKSFL